MNLCATFNCSLSWFKPALLGFHHAPHLGADGAFRFRTAIASLTAGVNVCIQTRFTVVHFTIVPHPPPDNQLRSLAGVVAVLISKTLAQDYATPFLPNYRRKDF